MGDSFSSNRIPCRRFGDGFGGAQRGRGSFFGGIRFGHRERLRVFVGFGFLRSLLSGGKRFFFLLCLGKNFQSFGAGLFGCRKGLANGFLGSSQALRNLSFGNIDFGDFARRRFFLGGRVIGLTDRVFKRLVALVRLFENLQRLGAQGFDRIGTFLGARFSFQRLRTGRFLSCSRVTERFIGSIARRSGDGRFAGRDFKCGVAIDLYFVAQITGCNRNIRSVFIKWGRRRLRTLNR